VARMTAIDHETPGQRVRRLRRQIGLSQRQLVIGLDRCSYAYLSRIEAGTRTPSAHVLEQLATKLGTTALFLATGRTDAVCPFCRRAA
jgi:transcriptional regulator with XRE-family HTH domain